MQKVLLIALLAFSASATLNQLCTAATAGYVWHNNVCQKCHLDCATCDGPLSSNCLTCSVTGATVTAGTCACASNGTSVIKISGGAPECVLIAAKPSGESDCGVGFYFDGTTNTNSECVRCPTHCETCDPTAASKSECTADASGCWAGLSGSAGFTCPYALTDAYIPGIDTSSYDHGTSTVAIVEGYWLNTSTFELEPCAKGCATCSSSGVCTTCDSDNGFTLSSSGAECECATGKFLNTDSQTCGCISGCATCSDGTTCTTCDSDHDLSSADNTCVAKSSGDTTSPSTTTSGETGTGATNDEANASSNVAPAAGCADTLIGCTACDSADNTKCTTCNATYYFKLNGTVCDCVTGRAQHPTTKTCGHQCTADCGATQTCQFASGASAPACADAPTTSSGLLITAVSMIFAVILA